MTMTMTQKDDAKSLGILAICMGVLFNEWVLGFLATADRSIESKSALTGIFLIQLAFIGSGAFILWKRPKLSVTFKDICIVFSTIAVCLILMEIGVRIWVGSASDEIKQTYRLQTDLAPSELRWAPHHYLNYYPTPGYKNGKTSHNSLGYRDREFTTVKAPGVFRIVALGGSTTYTISVEDNEKTFTRNLEKILKTRGYDNLEVINAGVGGYNSWESLINLAFRVLDLDPDMIIIYHGTNDVHTRFVRPDKYAGDNSGSRRQWSDSYIPPIVQVSYLVRLISLKLNLGLHRQVGIETIVGSKNSLRAWSASSDDPAGLSRVLAQNPPKYFKRNLMNMIGIARAQGVQVVLSSWAHTPKFDDYASTPYYIEGFAQNNIVVSEVAAEQKVPFYDFAAEMPKDKKYWADGKHVNEAGSYLKATLFANFLQSSVLVQPAP